MEEARMLQEREALAKEAESLEALASAKVDQKTWGLLFGKLQRLIEQDKDAALEAHAPEGIDAFMSWLEVHHKTKAEAPYEETTPEESRSGAQQAIEKAATLVEIDEITLQMEELKRLASESKAKAEASLDNVRWGYQQSSECLNEAVEYLSNAITAISSNNAERATPWKEAAIYLKEAAEEYEESAQMWLQGDKNQACYLDAVAGSFLIQARNQKYLAQASESEVMGKWELAQHWRDIAQQNQRAAEYLTRSADLYPAVKEEEGKSWNSIGYAFLNVAKKLGKAIEAEEAGKPAVAQAWREAATLQQQSVEFHKKAVEAYAVGKEVEAGNCFNTGLGFYWAAEKLGRAIEAEEARKPAVAKAWHEAAVLQQQSVEFLKKAAETCVEGKEKEVASWFHAGNGFFNAAEKLEKAIEAEEARKSAIAQAWQEAAVLQQQSVEFFKEAAEAYVLGKREEAQPWHLAGNGFYWAAEKLGRAIEAEEAGKPAIAQAWREAAAIQEWSVELYKKAAEAYTTGKEEEAGNWENAGNGFYWATKKLGRAIEAEEARKSAIAQAWREAATLQQQSVEFYKKVAETCVEGKEKEVASWFSAGNGFYFAAEKLEKGIEAEEARKVAMAQAWREAAVLQQQSVEFYKKAAVAYVIGEWLLGENCNNIGAAFYFAAEKLEKAIEAEETGKPIIAKVWREAAVLQQQSGELYKKTVEAYAVGKEKEAASWKNAGNAFFSATKKLEKVVEAVEERKPPVIAQAWREAAELQQQSVEFYKKAAETCVEGKEKEVVSWFNAGNGFYFAAEKLEKAIEAEKIGKPIIAKVWREAAVLQQQSGEFYKKAAEAYAVEKEKETASWKNAGNAFFSATKKLEKVVEAVEERKSPVIAQAWREAAELQQQSGEFYKKAAEACATGKEKEGGGWFSAGRSFYHAAEKLGNGIEAEEAGNSALAQAWRQAAEKYQEAHACWKTTAEAMAAKHWITHKSKAKAAMAAADEASQAAERLAHP